MQVEVKRIQAYNFRAIKALDVTFPSVKKICFIGPNGSGKSAILSLLDKGLRTLLPTNDDIPRNNSTSEVSPGARFSVVAFTVSINGDDKVWISLNNQGGDLEKNTKECSEILGFDVPVPSDPLSSGWLTHLPEYNKLDHVYLYRPANRGEQAEYRREGSISHAQPAYSRWVGRRAISTAVSSGRDIVESLIKEIVLDYLLGEHSKNTSFATTYAFSTVKALLSWIFQRDGEIAIESWPYRVIRYNGIPMKNLSDGEVDILVTAMHILAQQLEIMRGRPALSIPTGICIIDEMDIHLHPRAQSMVASKLAELFPTITFIFSTHSPFVVQSLNYSDTSIVRFPDGNLVAHDYSAWPIEDILRVAFDTPQWGALASNLIDKFRGAIKDGNLANARAAYREIQTHGPAIRSLGDRILFVEADSQLRSKVIGEE